jgi:isoprenylcysteine carboxyl methyltransferase (ICMT) family protein YpbQ
MENLKEKSQLPESPTCLWINGLALLMTVAMFLWLKSFPELSILFITICSLLTLASGIIVGEVVVLKSFRRSSTGLDFSLRRPRQWGDILVRLLGFYGTLLLIAGLYWLLPEYRNTQFIFVYKMLSLFVPVLCVVALPYFVWLDAYLIDPKDGYWHMGTLLLVRTGRFSWSKVRQHLLAWLVKTFFLPLMFIYLAREMMFFLGVEGWPGEPQTAYQFGLHLIFGVDVLFSTVGYIVSVRLFDSHVRSTEPTFLGWGVALFCYEPFYNLFYTHYVLYENDFNWDVWLKDHPVAYVFWGCCLLGLFSIYTLSTICFGIRFSNLTHRGILTNGPYRFCKHPAYVSKNIAWWLVAIPFLSGSTPWESLRMSLMLLIVNLIYFLRARTEERHLAQDPTYVQYALAMNEHSLFAWLGQWFPLVRFKAPESQTISE